jgi:endonuclease G
MRPATAAVISILLLGGAGSTYAAPAEGDIGFEHCAARYALIGLPTEKSDGYDQAPVELCRPGYAALFNQDTHNPDWVIERLPDAWLSGNAVRKNNFHADPQVATSTTPKAYTGQKFDRGHQAPAGDFKSSQDMTDQSFLMTNMAPQVGIGFNRNIWKDLETDVRGWVKCGGLAELYVVTGPVYGANETWTKNHKVRVPEAFFKVIYDPANKRALGMLLPNTKLNAADLPNYAVAISESEDQTGLVFFPALTKRQQNLLKKSAGNLWGTDNSCSGTGE